MAEFGNPKFGWFVRLNYSARTCNRKRHGHSAGPRRHGSIQRNENIATQTINSYA